LGLFLSWRRRVMFGPSPAAAPTKRARIIEEARRLLAADKSAEAAKALEPLVKRPKPDPEGLFLMALVAERQHRVDAAVSLATQSLSLLAHPDPMLLLARYHRSKGETDEGVAWCDRVLAIKKGVLPAICIKAAALEEAG